MDQIQAMRIFVRVVEAGTFTRAADSLGLPKGTVTKQIQALESRLHVKLLNRTTRRVTVTPDGAAYFERTARLLNDFDDIEASMTNAQANPTGRLRIDVGSSMARVVILPALASFCDHYPDIQVDLGVSDRTVDLITDNVDCVIRGGELTDQSLVARRIGNLPWVTVASPAYLKRYGVPQHPAEIEKRHHVVSFFSGSTRRVYPHEFHRGDEHIELSGPYRVAVNDSNAHMTAVLGGFGLSQSITYMAQPHLASGELVEILPDWTRPPLPIHVVYPPNRHLSAKVRVFVDWAADLFAKNPGLQRR
jgi:LysR family transcriptional regulator for bpeEF and oprC